MLQLRTTPNSPTRQIAAMRTLDVEPENDEYIEVLHRIVWAPGYTVEVREAAIDRLAERDLDGLKTTIRRKLPNMNALQARRRICEIIAERGWVELTPALVSAWAVPILGYESERDRPEYKALAKLHGEEQIPDVIFDLFVESKRVSQQGLRTRCWELMHRLGYRERLVELLVENDPPPDDALLIDLHAAAVELGVIPHNREEILWLRKLRQPEHEAFWDEAASAVAALSPQRRLDLEIRDLAVVVSARRHDPELLEMSEAQLYSRLDAYLDTQRHRNRSSTYGGMGAGNRTRLLDWRSELTWGDLAAMLIAVQALQVPQVSAHLFDYAERDRKDESTEYGGVIRLDDRGRFEILEFPPRIRQHDQRFNASQEMIDAGYTAIFHFHMHVQRYRNSDYAGPGFGDDNYADNLRTNCLVFTFINENTLNVDYYRHGGVSVDLGGITRR
jgi:hypothetical protein